MRQKTDYTGVFYRTTRRHSGDESYYIVYKKNGKIVEEQVGRKLQDKMTPLKAAGIRSQRVKEFFGWDVFHPGKGPSKTRIKKSGMPVRRKTERIKSQTGSAAQKMDGKISAQDNAGTTMEITHQMLEQANDAVYISQENVTIFVNSKTEKITGYTSAELVGQSSFYLTHPEDLKVIRDRYFKRFRGEEVSDLFPHRILDKDRNIKWIEVSTVMITWAGRPALLNFMRDITKRKQDEDALKSMNTALDTLLKKREKDIKKSEEKMMRNINELILPYIMKLKAAGLSYSDSVNIEIIEKHLQEITSPFLSRLSSGYTQFSPREMQVADMIRKGMTTKEISGSLNVSTNAIDIYRQNIRRKLGLNKKKINLGSFLISLGKEQGA